MERSVLSGLAGTFSIVALDSATGDLGVAVQSKYFAVGSVISWAKAGVGAVATQAWVQPKYGFQGLDYLGRGHAPDETLSMLLDSDREHDTRQVGMIDAQGRVAQHSGRQIPNWAGHRWSTAADSVYAVQGNTITGPEVLEAMSEAFVQIDDRLAARLLAALEAGQAAGGDRRGQQSAVLLVVRDAATMRVQPTSRKHPIDAGMDGCGDRYVDLRVDDHQQPIEELRRLWELWQEWWA